MLFLHIGLHKTGTTFLQREVFPLWKGIKYLPQDKLEYLTRMDHSSTYLLSREGLSGQNWMGWQERNECIARLAQMLPEAEIIMSFRRHSGYIASSYNQYLQRGGYLPFEEYFDLVEDNGFMKKKDFYFREKIDSVSREFGSLPYVIMHEELLSDLSNVLSCLEKFIGGKAPDAKMINMKRHNKSVGYYPAKVLRFLNSRARSELNPTGSYSFYHWRLKRLGLDPRSICQSGLGFLPSRSLLGEVERNAIDEFYKEDWNYVQQCARKSSDLDPAISPSSKTPAAR